MKQVLPKLCSPAPGRNITCHSFRLDTLPPFLRITFKSAGLVVEAGSWALEPPEPATRESFLRSWLAAVFPDSTCVAGAKAIFLSFALFPEYNAPFHCAALSAPSPLSLLAPFARIVPRKDPNSAGETRKPLAPASASLALPPHQV